MLNQKFNTFRFIILFSMFLLCDNHIQAQKNTGQYFVFLNRNPDRTVISDDSAKKLQAGHMANMEELSKQGKLICAGPFDNGGGIFVIIAGSTSEALEIISGDPTIKTKRFLLECFPLTINSGNICKVEGDIKMVDYQFIRYRYNPMAKMPSPVAIQKVFEEHITYLAWLKGQDEKLLFDADFGQWDGGFMLVDQQDAEKANFIANNDPLVISGVYTQEFRKLWVAQGAFCIDSVK